MEKMESRGKKKLGKERKENKTKQKKATSPNIIHLASYLPSEEQVQVSVSKAETSGNDNNVI